MGNIQDTYPTVRSWLIGCTYAAIFLGFTSYYLLFHIALGIPLLTLGVPYAVHAGTTVIAAPFLYLARRRQCQTHGRDVSLYYWILGPYSLINLWSWTFFGLRAGVIQQHSAGVFYVSAFTICAVFFPAGYYLNRIISRRS